MKLLPRLAQLIVTLWGVTTLVFLFLHLSPGDPVEIMLGENAQESNKTELRASLHLDKPLHEQYFLYWRRLASGDLGTSFTTKKPVAALIAERIPATFSLTMCALAFAVAVALPLGVLSASRPGSRLDGAIYSATVFGTSLPSFFLGPLLIMLFCVELNWLPVSERGDWTTYVLPAGTLGIGLASILLRMVRASMLEAVSKDYITTARSKGLAESAVYFKHALKNALTPVITLFCLQLGGLLAGAVITETIFDWPGIGELTYRALQSRDFPLVQGCVLVITCVYVSANVLADFLYVLFNPKAAIE